MLRVYEFDRYNGTVYQVDLLLDGDELWTHTTVTNPNDHAILGYCARLCSLQPTQPRAQPPA